MLCLNCRVSIFFLYDFSLNCRPLTKFIFSCVDYTILFLYIAIETKSCFSCNIIKKFFFFFIQNYYVYNSSTCTLKLCLIYYLSVDTLYWKQIYSAPKITNWPTAHLQTQLKGDNSLVYNIHTEIRKLKTTKIKKISNIELHSIYMPHKKKLHVKIWLYNIVMTHKDYRNLLRAAKRLSLNLRFVSIA